MHPTISRKDMANANERAVLRRTDAAMSAPWRPGTRKTNRLTGHFIGNDHRHLDLIVPVWLAEVVYEVPLFERGADHYPDCPQDVEQEPVHGEVGRGPYHQQHEEIERVAYPSIGAFGCQGQGLGLLAQQAALYALDTQRIEVSVPLPCGF
jgi:hypothetical protein